MKKITSVKQINWEKEETRYILSDYNTPRKYFKDQYSLKQTILNSGSFKGHVRTWRKKQLEYRSNQSDKVKEDASSDLKVNIEKLLEAKKEGYQLLMDMISELTAIFKQMKELENKIKNTKKKKTEKEKMETDYRGLRNFFYGQASNLRENILQIKLELGEVTSNDNLNLNNQLSDEEKEAIAAIESESGR